jgi:hypothetical protein
LGYKDERTLRDFFFQRKRLFDKFAYKEGIHYESIPIRTKKNQNSNAVFLSIPCFKDVCQQVGMEKGHTIRKYFSQVEDLYRDALQMRWSNRRQKYHSEEEIDTTYSLDDNEMPEDGNIRYFDLIIQHGKTFYKIGHTKQGRIRMVNLRSDYPGKHHFAKVIRIHQNVALEEIIKALSEKWMLQCSGSPCPKEIILTNDFPIDDVLTASQEALAYGFERLHQLQDSHANVLNTSSDSDSDSNTTFEFRRKGHMYQLPGSSCGNIPRLQK